MSILIPREDDEQMAFVAWFKLQFPGTLLFAVPNGELRDSNRGRAAIRGFKLKKMGTLKGVWDLSVQQWHLWIEMKRYKLGRLTPEQIAFKEALWPSGYSFIVAKGCEDGIKKVQLFIKEGRKQCYLN